MASVDLCMSLLVHVEHHASYYVEGGEADAYLAAKLGQTLAPYLSDS